MLEFFVIFSKSGIVLFATVHDSLDQVVNGLVKHVFLEERIGQYQTDHLQIKYLLDNEFELVYVVGYQKFLQLSYVDKFLSDVQLAFRDKFSDFDLRRILNSSFSKHASYWIKTKKNPECSSLFSKDSKEVKMDQLSRKRLDFCDLIMDGANIIDFNTEFSSTYERCVKSYNHAHPRQESMRSFKDSAKSKKTIASMIQNGQHEEIEKKEQLVGPKLAANKKQRTDEEMIKSAEPEEAPVSNSTSVAGSVPFKPPASVLAKLAGRSGESKLNKKAKKDNGPSKENGGKKGKAARQWDLSGSNPDEFDFSKKPVKSSVDGKTDGDAGNGQLENSASISKNVLATTLTPEDLKTNLEITDSESSDDDNDEEEENGQLDNGGVVGQVSGRPKSYFGTIWKSISYNKTLTQDDLVPILEPLREHLTAKNVAAEIAEELCKSVGRKLEGQNVNTWTNLKRFARDALQESILNILNPNRSINVLREIQAKQSPPYVIVFCGVNGVGKSTNLAKIANWLITNKMKVLVVAGDTFRAGAVEQLKTHVMALKSIHERGKQAPVKIELFERGYGKDSSGIAWDAIKYARNNQFDVVMVDTAGRMQDNEPLMKELAKLIKNNTPDLTLFVGEALVGNEAVDQLTKFNRSLLDCGCRVEGSSRSAIDGILLTKFDTIDDQVGAAISMTYVTGQPIVFVGVGQTYRDLKQLDAKAVTKALMR